MMPYTEKKRVYNPTWKPFFERVYDVLVRHAGATEKGDTRDAFIEYFTRTDSLGTEFRFGGRLGMGGKFWRNAGTYYVSCYPEDLTTDRAALLVTTNTAIEALIKELKPSSAMKLKAWTGEIFLAYPAWRKLWRKWFPLERKVI